jgi:di/tricarboxylate transporter
MKKNYGLIYFLFASILVLGISFHFISPAVFCLIIVVHMLFMLMSDFYSVEFTVISSLAIMMVASVFSEKPFLEVSKGLSGFSEPTVFTVAALFVVAKGIQSAGVMQFFLKTVLGRSSSTSTMLMRLSGPLMTLSAFLNNTPIVAIFTPYLREWAIKNKIAPSKILIPLSYITIFGGMLTLIGTSTNLVVHGLAHKEGIEIGFWAPIWVGLPCAIIGVLFIITFGDKLLPNRIDLLETTKDHLKPYIFVLEVSKGSIYHHKTILDSGLRDLEDCFLFEVHRGDEVYTPVKGTFEIKEGDYLYFKGNHDHVIDLFQKPGLSLPGQSQEYNIGSNAQYLEVVIAPSSPLIDKTIDEVWFNRTYDATVLAFHRNGENIEQHISKIPLKMGDTLILLAGKGFRRIWQNSNVFNFATPLREDLDKKSFFTFALVCLFLMILLPELYNFIPFFPKVPLVLSAIICSCLFIQFQLIEKNGLIKLMDWSVLIVIGAAFGLSNALQDSGAASLLGNFILKLSGDNSPWVALALVYIGTSLLTEMITNNAAAALFFPLALTVATTLNVSPLPFVMAVMSAASCSFATPFGYQTNMMVYGPGNYKNIDFLKIGLPINIIFFIVAVVVIPLVWKF